MNKFLTSPCLCRYRAPVRGRLSLRGICGWLLLACVAVASPGVGADVSSRADAYPKKINFRNIMQNQDIAIGEVEAITQDHEGFIWLGGRNALLRYDGYEFLPIRLADGSEDAGISPITQVLELFEDSRHDLWAATRSGLYQYDRSREVMLPVRDSQGTPLFRETIYALAESRDGELLIGAGSGLAVFNTGSRDVKLMSHNPADANSLPSNAVSDLLVDQQGLVWVGLDEGLVRIDWKTKQQTLFIPDPANAKSTAVNAIRVIAQDHQGRIWAGSESGIYRLDPVTGAFTYYRHDPKDPFSLAHDFTRQILVDKQGWVWTGSDGGGLSLYDEPNDRFLRFSYQDGRSGYLSSNTVRRIYEDEIGDIWVGTYPSGVNIYDRSTAAITVYKQEPNLNLGLLDKNVEAIEEDKDGNLWIGAGGVTRYNPEDETFVHYQHTRGPDSRVGTKSILNGVIDSDGEIRFGSWAQGIQLYNPETDRFDTVPADPTLVKRGERTSTQLNDLMIWSIYEDKRKDLWIATHYNGLTKFDKKTGLYTFYPHDVTNPTASTVLSSSVAWISFEDSQGRFWIGTANGLNLMDRDKGTFKQYLSYSDDPRGLVNGSVLSIHEDRKGRLWFGTDGGIHLYHPETDDFTVYGAKDGFVDQGIRAIIEDPSGNLWMGTNNGVVMFNPDTRLVRNYTRYNGELIGGIATGAALATRRGDMVFGARTGLYIFDANKILINEKAPAVVLTDFKIFTQSVAIGGPEQLLTKAINQTDEITLNHTKAMIAFNFAALNYRDPEKNQYAYKLEGFDDKWREVGDQRSALYTNLPAGKYQFKVKASNNDGIWNTEGRSVSLIILPPPWKTWWAYCIYFLLALALLMLFVHTQHKQVLDERKTSRKLELKVEERTAELRQKNEELGQAYEQLEAISLSDPLTGLSNRRYLQKLMPMDVAKVQREYSGKYSKQPQKKPSLDLTFFILDVDLFKSVNDIYGHTAGDHLLIQLSELLTDICRDSDCVIRWGGEEFLIVSRFTDRDDAPLTAERIRVAIEQHPFTLPDGTRLNKTCSIGFACFPFLPDHPMDLTWEQVIDIADHALYAAKRSGRNRSVGIVANANTSEEMLYQHIRGNLKAMIKNNELTVIAEDADDLKWD